MLFFKKKCKDKYQNKKYFQKKLKKINKTINNCNKWADTKGDINNYNMYVNKLYLNKLIVLYTLNYKKNKMMECAKEYIKHLKSKYELNNQLNYKDIIIGLSLSLIFDLSIEEIKFLNNYKLDDKYVDISLQIVKNKIFNNEKIDSDFYFKDSGLYEDYDIDNESVLKIKDNDFSDFLDYILKIKEKNFKKKLKYYEENKNKNLYNGSYDIRLTALVKALGYKKEKFMDSDFIMNDLL